MSISYSISQVLEDLEKQKQSSKFWNITKAQGFILSKLVELKNPQRILEFGTSNGYSTLWLLKEATNCRELITIDVSLERITIAKQNFKQANVLEKIKCIEGEMLNILDKDLLQGSFDVIFIDAAQEKYSELVEKLQEKKFFSSSSLLIFDNVLSHKHLSEFIKKMEEQFITQKIDIGGGFLVTIPHKKNNKN